METVGSVSLRPPIATISICLPGSGSTPSEPRPRPVFSDGPGSQLGGPLTSAQKKRTQLPVLQSPSMPHA